MTKLSNYLFLALGATIIASGLLAALREAAIISFSLKWISPLFIALVGIWMVICVFKCKSRLQR